MSRESRKCRTVPSKKERQSTLTALSVKRRDVGPLRKRQPISLQKEIRNRKEKSVVKKGGDRMDDRHPAPKDLIKKGERLEESCYDRNGNLVEIVTSDRVRTVFFVYKVEKGKAVKVGKGSSPVSARKDAKTAKKG